MPRRSTSPGGRRPSRPTSSVAGAMGCPWCLRPPSRSDRSSRPLASSRETSCSPRQRAGARSAPRRSRSMRCMAGCRPEYMPVLLAALEAMADPAFTLHGAITSTGGSATLVVVNGPIRQRLGFNAGGNVFGPGLASQRHAGARHPPHHAQLPGRSARPARSLDAGTSGEVLVLHRRARGGQSLGAAARHARVAARDERGDRLRCRGTAQRLEPLRRDGRGGRRRAGGRDGGARQLQPGRVVHRAGARARADPGARRLEQAAPARGALRTRPAHASPTSSAAASWPVRWSPSDETRWEHRGRGPEDIHLVVAGGGAGGHSAFIPSWSRDRNSLSVTRPIRDPHQRSQTS